MEDDVGQLKKRVQIRQYREGDENNLNELFQLVFRVERPLESWYWKYRDNPITDLILISLAETPDGRVVGMYPLLIMEIKVKEEYVLAVQLVEIAIHPDFRGRWIVKEMKYFLQPPTIESGVRFGFGFPTKEHAKVGVRYMGYNLLGELPIMGLKLNRFSSSGGGFVRSVAGKILDRLYFIACSIRFFRQTRGERQRRASLQIVEIESFDREFDDLWETISREHQVIAHRSSRYLNWRYVDNMMSNFTILAARKGGKIKGYMVFTTRIEEGEKNGIIFDYIFGKDAPEEGKLLLLDGLRSLMRQRVKSIRSGTLPHTDLHRHLESLGFEKWPISPLVNFESLDERLDVNILGDLNQWYLSIGDTDLFGW